ncbi:OmpH family outer membrane protein [Henriciella sp.]|uniref:OmpH family outer membrane protein n=1 Tax=Henriciella sp. TaxID=1968823 RepID=UPI0026025384|nr:OmpH family outer membrane protein [Henriciella sp.]
MQILKAALASISIAFAGATAFAPAATAQGSTVVVIDQAKIMRDSAGGQDITSKVNAIENTMMSELQPTADALQTERDSLRARSENMSMDAITADEQLRSEFQDFARKSQQFNRQRQIAAAELQATERQAWSTFFTAMQPVLEEVVTETGADIMFDRSDAVYASADLDATDRVISKMNAKMPTVEVVRQQIDPQQLQQAQQQ